MRVNVVGSALTPNGASFFGSAFFGSAFFASAFFGSTLGSAFLSGAATTVVVAGAE